MLFGQKDLEILIKQLSSTTTTLTPIVKVLIRFQKDEDERPIAEILYITDNNSYQKHKQNLNMVLPIFDLKNFNLKTKNINNTIYKILEMKTTNLFLKGLKKQKIEKYLLEDISSFAYFKEQQNTIITQIFFILYCLVDTKSKIKNIETKLFKYKFGLSDNYKKKLDNFINDFIEKKLQQLDKKQISTKRKLKYETDKILSSREFKTKYEVEYTILLNEFIAREILSKNRAKTSLEQYFFDSETSKLLIDSKQKFKDKQSLFEEELFEYLYYKIKKEEILKKLKEEKIISKIYKEAENIYNFFYRNILLENIYELNNTTNLTTEEIETYKLLYTYSKKFNYLYHNKNLHNFFNFFSIYYKDIESLKEEHFNKRTELFNTLLKLGIDEVDWQEKAEQAGIKIDYDYLLLDEKFNKLENIEVLDEVDLSNIFISNLNLEELKKFLQHNQLNTFSKPFEEFDINKVDVVFDENIEEISYFIKNTQLYITNNQENEEEIPFEEFINIILPKLPYLYKPQLQLDELILEDEFNIQAVKQYFLDMFEEYKKEKKLYFFEDVDIENFYSSISSKLNITIPSIYKKELEKQLKKEFG